MARAASSHVQLELEVALPCRPDSEAELEFRWLSESREAPRPFLRVVTGTLHRRTAQLLEPKDAAPNRVTEPAGPRCADRARHARSPGA